jgi:truncated hemoglobin YjbI
MVTASFIAGENAIVLKNLTKLVFVGVFAVLGSLSTASIAMAEDGATEQATLYERLGSREGINKAVLRTIELHQINPLISHYFTDVDLDALANHVTDFFAMGTGGPANYTGRDMTSAHADMHMSNADFDSAVADVLHAVRDQGAGEGEVAEVAAILESLRAAVIGAGS